MISLVQRSAWSWNTSGSGGFSVDVVAATGGLVRLNNPAKKVETFHFGGLGMGVSTPGIKIPKLGGLIGKLLSGRMFNAAGGGTDLKNWGWIYRTPSTARRELTRSDFTGPCIMADIGASCPLIGRTASIFLCDVSPMALIALTNPAVMALETVLNGNPLMPRAVIMSWGDSRGLVAGLNGYVGYLG